MPIPMRIHTPGLGLRCLLVLALCDALHLCAVSRQAPPNRRLPVVRGRGRPLRGSGLVAFGSPPEDAGYEDDRWLRHTATVDVPEGGDAAFALYARLDQHESWSPWLKEVVVLTPGDVGLGTRSTWTLAVRGLDVSWQSEVSVFEPSRTLEWRSLTGLPNSGKVRFAPHPDAQGCQVSLSVRYRVPRFIRAVLPLKAVDRLVSGRLRGDLGRFADRLAKEAAGP